MAWSRKQKSGALAVCHHDNNRRRERGREKKRGKERTGKRERKGKRERERQVEVVILLGTDFPQRASVVVSLGLSAPITGPLQSFKPRVALLDSVKPAALVFCFLLTIWRCFRSRHSTTMYSI